MADRPPLFFPNRRHKRCVTCVPDRVANPARLSFTQTKRQPRPFAVLEWRGGGAVSKPVKDRTTGQNQNTGQTLEGRTFRTTGQNTEQPSYLTAGHKPSINQAGGWRANARYIGVVQHGSGRRGGGCCERVDGHTTLSETTVEERSYNFSTTFGALRTAAQVA